MSSKSVSEVDFVLACLKSMEPNKPNFDAVAERVGSTKTAAYFRHYSMMKKYTGRMESFSGQAPATIPTTPRKRAKKVKEDPVDDVDIDDHHNDDDYDKKTPAKKRAKVSAPPKSAAKPKGTATAKKTDPKTEKGGEEADQEALAAAAVKALAEIVAIEDN